MSKMYLKLEEGRSTHKRGKRSHAPMLRRLPTTILILVMVLVLIALVAAVKAPAHAEEWVWRTYCNQSRTHCYDKRVRAYQPRVYSYDRRWNDDEDDRSGRQCKETRKAVGDQHLTMEGAKKAANDAWAAAVRFHIGEKHMDLNNARHIVYTCSRSSIKEAGSSVTTLGQALQRCELSAQPCQPLAEHEKREEDR